MSFEDGIFGRTWDDIRDAIDRHLDRDFLSRLGPYLDGASADAHVATFGASDTRAGRDVQSVGMLPTPSMRAEAKDISPAAPDDRWQALKDAAQMTKDWVFGDGPTQRTFGPGTVQVAEMAKAPGVAAARNNFYSKNDKALIDGRYQDLQSYTNHRAKFGLGDFLTNGSPTQQFVGSYRVDIAPVNNGRDARFTLTNDSSFKSLTYGQGPAWERSALRPGGNMRQTYTWTEPVKRP